MPEVVDLDNEIEKFKKNIKDQAALHAPAPVLVEVIDGAQQYQRGWVFGKHSDKTVELIVPSNYDVRNATTANPAVMWAMPPNPSEPASPYFAVGFALNASGNRIPNMRVGTLTFSALATTAANLDAGTTKTTPGGVDKWVKMNVDGTLYYIPAYTSKTT